MHDLEWFRRDVLPRLASVKLSEIVEAAGLLEGVRVGHQAREVDAAHVSTWAALTQFAEVVNDSHDECHTWAVRAEPRGARGSTFTAGLLLLIERSGGSPPRMHRVCEGAVEGYGRGVRSCRSGKLNFRSTGTRQNQNTAHVRPVDRRSTLATWTRTRRPPCSPRPSKAAALAAVRPASSPPRCRPSRLARRCSTGRAHPHPRPREAGPVDRLGASLEGSGDETAVPDPIPVAPPRRGSTAVILFW